MVALRQVFYVLPCLLSLYGSITRESTMVLLGVCSSSGDSHGFLHDLWTQEAQENQEADELKVMTHFVTSEDSNFESLNQFAWGIVMNPDGGPKKLELAMTAAKRANQLEPKRHEILDTLASLHFLSGNISAAIRHQMSAIEQFHESFDNQKQDEAPEIFREAYQAQVENLRSVYVSQLARFQRAIQKARYCGRCMESGFVLAAHRRKKRRKAAGRGTSESWLRSSCGCGKGSLLVGHLAIEHLPRRWSFTHTFEEGAAMEWGESTHFNVVQAVQKRYQNLDGSQRARGLQSWPCGQGKTSEKANILNLCSCFINRASQVVVPRAKACRKTQG